jgi:hypothetical protein
VIERGHRYAASKEEEGEERTNRYSPLSSESDGMDASTQPYTEDTAEALQLPDPMRPLSDKRRISN